MIKLTSGFIQEILDKRSVILELAKRQFLEQNRDSYLGFIWTFIQPLTFILILYLVFTVGLRAQTTVTTMPFALYLVCGMVCWMYFSANLLDMTNAIKKHSYLVKNVTIKLGILPFVPLLSSLVPHIFLVLVAFVVALLQGISPTWYLLQLVYYWLAMSALLIGLGWLTSSCSIFIGDVRNIVALVVQFGFWLTPIFWNIALVPAKYQWIIKLNPVNYLVEGYRDSIALGIPFWQKPGDTLYFWIFCFVTLLVGARVYRKLRPDFAEVI